MTQHEKVLAFLRVRPRTTNEFLSSGLGLAAEYRARISELRRKGYGILYESAPKGRGLYTLTKDKDDPRPVRSSLFQIPITKGE